MDLVLFKEVVEIESREGEVGVENILRLLDGSNAEQCLAVGLAGFSFGTSKTTNPNVVLVLVGIERNVFLKDLGDVGVRLVAVLKNVVRTYRGELGGHHHWNKSGE